MTSRRLLGHERPGGHPPPFVSAQQSPAPPPLRDNRRPAPLPKACGGPCLGPPTTGQAGGNGGGGSERPCGAATPEDERRLSSAGCGCQSWLRLRRKRRILAKAGEDGGVLRRSGPAEVPPRSHTLIFIRNLSGRVLALAAATATSAAALSLPAPPYRRLMTT